MPRSLWWAGLGSLFPTCGSLSSAVFSGPVPRPLLPLLTAHLCGRSSPAAPPPCTAPVPSPGGRWVEGLLLRSSAPHWGLTANPPPLAGDQQVEVTEAEVTGTSGEDSGSQGDSAVRVTQGGLASSCCPGADPSDTFLHPERGHLGCRLTWLRRTRSESHHVSPRAIAEALSRPLSPVQEEASPEPRPQTGGCLDGAVLLGGFRTSPLG